MLHGDYLSVLQSRSPDELRDEIVRFGRALGFNFVAAMAVVDRGIGRSDFASVYNAPPDYLTSFNSSEASQRDPVMQHCKRNSLPIIWDQHTYTTTGQGELWEEMAQYGYHTGIAMALHLPEGRHFMLGVDRDGALPSDRQELTRLVADLQLFAVHALDAAMRVLVPAEPVKDMPSLTPRELEALRWTMDGKTAWEVGAILGITERTAVLHLNNAMRKLGCVNKHQAVLKALRLGLVR
jgi:DNA-binding CsgD family transcriptional regulator